MSASEATKRLEEWLETCQHRYRKAAAELEVVRKVAEAADAAEQIAEWPKDEYSRALRDRFTKALADWRRKGAGMNLGTSIDDFKRPDGSTDWAAYEAAKTANGDECDRCGSFNAWPKGKPWTCYGCQQIDKPGELLHDSFVRCPYCQHIHEPETWDCDTHRGWYSPDQHEINCHGCGESFEFTTIVRYSFESPALDDQVEPQVAAPRSRP